VTPEETLEPIVAAAGADLQPRSTTGLTTKVIKGSVWTLAGQVLPLAVTFIATPITIRLLGSEAYGVLVLVGLIPNYLSFADFGMSLASTKFASGEYSLGDAAGESQVVWTAAMIAGVSAGIVALLICLFSVTIIAELNVPQEWVRQADIGLKLAALSFFCLILSQVLNSPMLSRLRMDLNSLINGTSKILLAALTPVVIYLGGGIVGAVGVGAGLSFLALLAILYTSGRLLPELFKHGFSSEFIRPLLRFGGGLLISAIAVVLLVNLEKLFLTRLISVRSLAYYSIAFTFASLATFFSTAMIQSTIPAFSQLIEAGKKSELEALFNRSVRLSLIWIFPLATGIYVAARPFLTLWAGADFGENSTGPLQILLIGLVFSIPAYVAYAVIVAAGKASWLAKLYWLELFGYAVVSYIAISRYGVIGAACAWTTRILFDSSCLIWMSSRITRFSNDAGSYARLALAAGILVPAIVLSTFYDLSVSALIVLLALSLSAYSVIVFTWALDPAERSWIWGRIRQFQM